MNRHEGKLVAVVDPIWEGHHPMYFAQFAASFLRHGARVIAACPDPDDAKRELIAVAGQTAVDEKVIFKTLEPVQRSLFNGRFEGDPLRTAERWKHAAEVISGGETELGKVVDLVYFPYLDTYLRFLPFAMAPEIFLGRSWSGLYLRNHHHGNAASWKQWLVLLGKGDALLRSDSCAGIGVLDERFIPQMERHSGKRVRLYPDFTNAALPEKPTALALDVLRKAGGRKIIGIIGMERRKGILTLLRTAELAGKRGLPLYFVCAGRIFRDEFTQDEWDWIRSFDGQKKENVHLDLSAGRIPSEEEVNSLFSVFQIAWAAYENFQGSSNTLGKAAAFEIPCLASDGGCIGRRIRKYGTGLTIPEGDAERALEAISNMVEQPPAGRYEDFRKLHSIQQLHQLLGELLDGLSSDGSNEIPKLV
jgi:glycosyltransferase involved in cell wall biosynthesis